MIKSEMDFLSSCVFSAFHYNYFFAAQLSEW